jgi:hypothetical protein
VVTHAIPIRHPRDNPDAVFFPGPVNYRTRIGRLKQRAEGGPHFLVGHEQACRERVGFPLRLLITRGEFRDVLRGAEEMMADFMRDAKSRLGHAQSTRA